MAASRPFFLSAVSWFEILRFLSPVNMGNTDIQLHFLKEQLFIGGGQSEKLCCRDEQKVIKKPLEQLHRGRGGEER
jgi:hypothetical protein